MKDQPNTVHLPASALHIWVEGASFVIRYPDSHTIRLPTTKYTSDGVNVGFACLIQLLQARETECGPIASPSAPVQHDVDKMVRDFSKPVKKAKKEAPGTEEQRLAAQAVMRRMGLI